MTNINDYISQSLNTNLTWCHGNGFGFDVSAICYIEASNQTFHVKDSKETHSFYADAVAKELQKPSRSQKEHIIRQTQTDVISWNRKEGDDCNSAYSCSSNVYMSKCLSMRRWYLHHVTVRHWAEHNYSVFEKVGHLAWFGLAWPTSLSS